MKERYDNLDGLRTISCLCIIAMHIKANSNYNLHPVFGTIVSSWTHFVPLFLMISGFGMFCGYYDKFKNRDIDLNSFYKKRYAKILPFFAFLMLIDVAVERSVSHIIEALTQASLVFGLLPNNQLEVIGVGWTLGVLFLFYMLFPFIVYLCWTRKRAWMTFGISIVLSLFCSFYYFTDKFVVEDFAARHNFLYCAPWIIGGGIVYLNRTEIKEFIGKHRWLWLSGCVVLSVAWYYTPVDNDGGIMLKNLILFLPWLMYAISVESRFLNNKIMKYLSGISLELYLAQMVIFRAVEKAELLYKFGNGWFGFVVVWILIVMCLIVFIEIWKRCYFFIRKKIIDRYT